MNKNDINKILNKMLVLKGQKLNYISRPGYMMSLGLGDEIMVKTACKNDKGKLEVKERLSSKYAVHIDGFFRITHQEKLVLSKNDMFKPNSQYQNDVSDDDNFEWDVEGNNKFDEHKENISSLGLVVEDIAINEFGDLKIILSNNYCIEVFIDTNEDEECWRFFEVDNSEKTHIVVTGCGYHEE